MTCGPPAEPALAGVQDQYPRWQCIQGISGMDHATHPATGHQAAGEGPPGVRDQIKAAQARHTWRTAR